ncbi:PH domain-containing protein [Arthrobacter sp. JZ12]|uniref:PH domain-containing protein n=1 Tax=Arthrobacter sp. JZ12 TaxID=2654190 RepID=UPI002B482F37|nr:PH domain-containing protein [Arthrobacter sp. JZ12]WRH25499.1 PH domain-containing protein [Arthrobacter sp. JZ12]
MNSPQRPAGTTVFRPRSSRWILVIAGVVVGVGLAASVASSGFQSLASTAPLLAIGAVAWWLFWYPTVVVGPAAVELRNPVRTVTVPWGALIHVDTKYALKLVTPGGSYSAWAAPAPGVRGTYAGKPEHMKNLPGTSYGPAGSVRPGDLTNTDSGLAALLVRTEWQRQVESGLIDTDGAESARVVRQLNWLPLAVVTGLLLLSIVTFAWQ